MFLQASTRAQCKVGFFPFHRSALSRFDSSGCSWITLVSLVFLLHACSDVTPAEDFQRGQIVPEAALGTVTTTGQLCQPTGPLLGAVIHTVTQTHTDTHTHAQSQMHRRSQKAQNDNARLDNMQLTQRGQEDTPSRRCDMLKSLSLCVQYKPWKHSEIIKSLIYTQWEMIREMTIVSHGMQHLHNIMIILNASVTSVITAELWYHLQ